MKYWFLRDKDYSYFAFSDALGKTHYFRVINKDFVTKCNAPDGEIESHEIQLGITPKDIRIASFMNLYGTAWLDSIAERGRLVLSVEKTVEVAVFILGKPIKDVYELPRVEYEDGTVERRWKANGEMIQQHIVDGKPGELICDKLSYTRDKLTRNEWFICRDFGPNDVYYAAEHEGEMCCWRVRDVNGIRYADACGVPAGFFKSISTYDVPMSVRSLLFLEEHGDSWLKEIRKSGRFSELSDGQLILRAFVLGRPIWPWDPE
jgi:hypothetical protein